ncbi:MAG: DUF1858 domain-containing protein [Dehalococcoidia bacterium]|nr:DUF1858 domain-containing protein [Dehalococcoidia bacterium]
MTTERVTGETSVREALRRYPEAERIFERHGLGGCGGPRGPLEPIAFFARVHKVEPNVLLRELNEFVAEAEGRPRPPASPPSSAKRPHDIFPLFIKTSLAVALTAGFSLGTVIILYPALGGTLGAWWLPHVQVHGHAQILGWVGLFIMGIAYHAVPRMKATSLRRPWLAYLSYGLVLAGLALRLAGQPMPGGGPVRTALLLLSGLSELAGAALFLALIRATVVSSLQPRDIYEKFMLAGAAWLCVAALVNLALLGMMASSGQSYIPGPADDLLLHIYFIGFIVSFIFGMSVRTMPTFLGLPALNARGVNLAFLALNSGLAVRLAGMALGEGAPSVVLATAGAALEVAAFVTFALAIRVFSPSQPWVKETGMSRGHDKFLRAAYVWLMVAALLDATFTVLSLAGLGGAGFYGGNAQRHALGLGFVTLTIFGMASRVVPVFSGTRLHAPRLLLPIFILSIAGTGLRVGFGLFYFVSPPLSEAMRGLSGILGLSGLALFAYVIWRTLDSAGSKATTATPARRAPLTLTVQPLTQPVARAPAGPVSAAMLVAEVLDRWPGTLDVFVHHGFAPLADESMRQALAATVTVEQACRMRSVDAGALLRDLNVAAARDGRAAQSAGTTQS